MLVLGIGGFMHDYNCCLIDLDRQRVAMIEAERLSRRKHHAIRLDDDLMAPIRHVCAELGVKPRHIDTVVFGHTDAFACKDALKREFAKANIVEVDHHLCHAAGAFYASPLDRALIVSVDGFGDGSSALVATGNGVAIDELWRIDDRNSIGLEYLRATYHLGLGGYGAEGKTQGLAAYGEPTLFDAYMNEITIKASGQVRLSPRLIAPTSNLAVEGGYLNTLLLTNAFLDDYGVRRIAPEPLTARHNDLAASIQKVMEHVVIELVRIGKQRSGATNLVLSGGVTMNSSLNGRLLAEGGFDRIFALPMASDRGIGLGAALYHVHATLKHPRFFTLDTAFFGSPTDDRAALRAMKKAGMKASRTDDPWGFAADALSRGQIIGWMQGRSEMGARALGNRSILADPRRAEAKDFVNARVKHRESFRPFAPAVLVERASEFFDIADRHADLSFMTFTLPTSAHAGSTIPATVHADNTARVQTVDATRHPDFARLIARFGEITGVPVLLNTSFNDKDEPIVETAEDAVATFLKTDMDALCIGHVIGTKT